MTRTLVIAECGSSWDCDLSKAFRLIDAAKASDADVCKFQWTSNAFAMARRRGLGADAAAMYVKYLQYPVDTLRQLKAHCDAVGIEFMVTVYLIEDIPVISKLVKRFKVSAFEAAWVNFIEHHEPYHKETIISFNDHGSSYAYEGCKFIQCVSEYPTPIEKLGLSKIRREENDGLSDHTTSTLTGALAVAAGATIVEKHIRLHDTDKGNPDYGHSLPAWTSCELFGSAPSFFAQYVSNIREAEKAL